ncbi:MAG: alpha/beta fold hydrolase [bacterium]
MPQAIIENRYVETNGVRLHAVAAGPVSGPPAILLHGFPEFWFAWRWQIAALAEAGYYVLAPDQRGYNLSDKPSGIGAYNLDVLADDVIGLIENTGHSKAYLIGHDWGGSVAWWTANKYPERIEKLAVLNVPHHTVMKREVARNLAQFRRSWYIYFFQAPFLPEFCARAFNWRLLVLALLQTSRPDTFSPEDLNAYRQAWSQPLAISCMINWYRALLRRPPRRLHSRRITVPTLLIWGARDRFLDRKMAALSIGFCDHGRLALIETATHWVQHEEPDRVNRLLLDFLKE